MKYKILSAILAATLAVTAFAACSKTDDGSTDATDAAVSASDASTEAASTEEASTEAASTEKATEKPEEKTTAAPTTEKPTEATTEAPVNEPETEAPAPVAPSYSANEIASAILSGTSFSEGLSASSGAIAAARFGISDYSDIAYYASTAAFAQEVLVVKTNNPGAAVAGANARKASQIEDYADYVPDEVPKLENAVILQSGEWVVFVVSNDAASARSIASGMIG